MAKTTTPKKAGRKANPEALKVLVRELEKSLDLQASWATGGSNGACVTFCACSADELRSK